MKPRWDELRDEVLADYDIMKKAGGVDLTHFKRRYPERRNLTGEEKKRLLAPCAACGHEDFRVIQLHHPDKQNKPLEVIPLCSNCHSLYHYIMGRNRRVSSNKQDIINLITLSTKKN